MYKIILVPLDGSHNADRAVDAALALLQVSDGSKLFLHVIRRWELSKEILDMMKTGEVTVSRLEIMQTVNFFPT